MIFAFEGISGCGKREQQRLLVDYLLRTLPPRDDGLPTVVEFKFPERSTWNGQRIDRFLKGNLSMDEEKAQRYFWVNRMEHSMQIEEALACGQYVMGNAMSLFIDTPVWKAAEQEGLGCERYEKVDFLTLVRAKYNRVFESVGGYKFDGTESVEVLHEEIRAKVMEEIAR